MKIGLYFGSFNPIHIGHLIIANSIANCSDLNQIWFVVSPQNPLKKSTTLLNEYHRLYLTQVAIEDNPKFRVSDVEFRLPRPSYTIDTLTYMRERFTNHEFSLILGSDSIQNIHRWKNSEALLRDYFFYIYKRPGFELLQARENFTILDAPLLEISSTDIRNTIKLGKSVRYLIPERVLLEIEKNNYYKK